MRTAPLLLTALATGTALAALAIPGEARACGGTFCDSGPASMPVDQSGENILFVMSEGFTEAHIQIQYVPEPGVEKFAWVIPLTDLPEFEVGSDPLFDQVLASTVPNYGFQNNFTGDGCGGSGFGDGGSGGGDSTGSPGTTGSEPPGPEIVLQEVVGAFEITVLSGGTAQEVFDWLTANEYAQDPAALPIMDEYLAEGYLFAAFKLNNDAEVDEIHPVVLRFPVEEACVPLRLTRIAALDDMDIRSFFLADSRVVPETYRHVLVNPLKLDWPNLASNYKELITLAVDAESADGRAFVTEYAGPSDIVPRGGIFSELWSSEPFRTAEPLAAFTLLRDQGLLDCFFDDFEGVEVCNYGHPLLRNMMLQYLPVPDGVDEVEFYGCPECFEPQIDVAAWDGNVFADLLEERIILPGQHANMLLDSYPTLTRMYTTISPGEMTADPFFHENPDLPGVDFTNQIATRSFGCGPDEVWILPDGREVYVPNGIWPDFVEEMPWEEEVQEIAAQGAPISLVTRTELINELLVTHNCMFNYPSAEACGNPSTGSDTGLGGSEGTEGTDGSTESGSAGLNGGALDDGCNCRSNGSSGSGVLLLGLGMLGLGWRSRRRR